MYNQTKEPKENEYFLLKRSAWIDIKGYEKEERNHYIYEQGELVIEMIKKAIGQQNELPNIYIISLFKTVANTMKNMLRKTLYDYLQIFNKKDIDNWIEKSCGTIHTFQGKQANEVILLLECDKIKGVNVAQCAGKKPNILNVAMTRCCNDTMLQ